jgi:hypothetical protein
MSVTYGSATAITISIASLADDGGYQSTFVENGTNLYDDVHVRIRTTGQASGTLTTEWYVYFSLGDGDYTDGCTGSDGTFTTANRRNSQHLASVQMDTTSQVEGGPYSVAAACGGSVPERWGLICINRSGATLSTTAGNHVIEYQGISY